MHAIELISDLIIGRNYTISNEGPYTFIRRDNNTFIFQKNGIEKPIDKQTLDKLLSGNEIQAYEPVGFIPTMVDYPNLDQFTFNTYNEKTIHIWGRIAVLRKFDRDQLLKIDTLLEELDITDLPTPDQTEYHNLINHKDWPLLKAYVHLISPDLKLPDQFA